VCPGYGTLKPADRTAAPEWIVERNRRYVAERFHDPLDYEINSDGRKFLHESS
jgi:hypothetical protein